MPKLTFRGVRLRYHDQRIKENNVFHRLNVTADFSGPVCESLGWNPDIARNVDDANLPARVLQSGIAILTPNPKPLREHAIEFGYQEMRDFKVVAKHDDDGEYTGAELRFQIVSAHKDLSAYIENWLRAIGTGEGADAQLKVSYAEQAKLDEQAEKSSDDDEPEESVEPALPNIGQTGGGRRGRKNTAEASVQ